MRGGFVRGGASHPHSWREMFGGNGESSARNTKKSKRLEGVEFSRSIAIVPRVEEWMEEEDDQNAHENTKKVSFASVVRSGGKGRPDEDGNEANSEDKNATPEEKEEEENISIQKLSNSLYNSELRKDWWENLIVKLFERKIFLSTIQRRLQAIWGRMGFIEFVRLCVEVELDKPLVSQYLINGKPHKIEYEGLHHVCFGCGRIGHEKN
ncbi:hypothetical protein Ahy_B03g065741 [Arachis hypogaea]|uniref:Zinc knuckle CX2CX4HX4C domain-containing protein n=1 Tax=Arachis hypogaea TaxID=3818 RepID=A0A445A2B2_ARAHY|nr:hypothetical protein Ahy_B03g065741 [Arachis hypogaea]